MAGDGEKQLYFYAVAGGVLFGIPAEKLSYIVSAAELDKNRTEEDAATGAPEAELNGQRIRLIGLSELMGLPQGEARYALLLRLENGLYGVMADEALDTAFLSEEQILPLPEAVRSAENAFLAGVAPTAGKHPFALLLHAEKLAEAAARLYQEREAAQ